MSTSPPTCLLSKPLSWHDRRCSTSPTISKRSSRRLRGEANRVGCWWQGRTERSIPTSNGGTPNELKVTRLKSQAPVTRSTFPGRKKLQLSSRKLHRTLGRKVCKHGGAQGHLSLYLERGSQHHLFGGSTKSAGRAAPRATDHRYRRV